VHPDQGPVVLIGLQQIYDKLVALEATVARLVDHTDGAKVDLADHENRLRALERSRWPLPAASVLISLAALSLALLASERVRVVAGRFEGGSVERWWSDTTFDR
jgi:hypothetical protein